MVNVYHASRFGLVKKLAGINWSQPRRARPELTDDSLNYSNLAFVR